MSLLQSIPFPLLDDPLKLATLLAALPIAFISAHVIPYLLDPYNQRRIPGPLLAKFSDLWLGLTTVQGHRSESVHELHETYGNVPA